MARDFHIRPEIEDDSEQGADVHRDIQSQSLILQVGECRKQYQMTGGADRQKLGNALNGCNQKEMEKWHSGCLGSGGLVGGINAGNQKERTNLEPNRT